MLSKQIILSHKGFYSIQRSWPNHMQSCNDSMNIISIYLYFIGHMIVAYNGISYSQNYGIEMSKIIIFWYSNINAILEYLLLLAVYG